MTAAEGALAACMGIESDELINPLLSTWVVACRLVGDPAGTKWSTLASAVFTMATEHDELPPTDDTSDMAYMSSQMFGVTLAKCQQLRADCDIQPSRESLAAAAIDSSRPCKTRLVSR